MKNCLLVLLMMFGINAYAEVNKWVDENNRVHYSDQPPPGGDKSKKIRSASDSKVSGDASSGTESNKSGEPKSIAEREAELKKKQKEKQEAAGKSAQEKANKEANKENCTNAQSNLKALQSGVRMMEIDAKGERVYLGDEERQRRITKTEKDVSQLCK
ncbi:MAG: DUF4124 domain-containing protein [Gallionella sp.]